MDAVNQEQQDREQQSTQDTGTKAWTDNNDGLELPADMDASQRSGALNDSDVDTSLNLDYSKMVEDVKIIPVEHLEKMRDVLTAEIERRGAEHHVHGNWKRGTLPGPKYQRICTRRLEDGSECGQMEEIELAAWNALP